MEFAASWVALLSLGIGAALVVFGQVFWYRRPSEFGAGEIDQNPDDPTRTTIARNDLVLTSFFENGLRIASAKYWGMGDKGIGLSLKGDQTEYLVTSANDWFEETRFRVKDDIRLLLLADGTPIVSAQRLPEALGGWKQGEKGESGQRCWSGSNSKLLMITYL